MKKQHKKTQKVKNISTYTHQGLRASWTIHGVNNEDNKTQKSKTYQHILIKVLQRLMVKPSAIC